MDEYHQNPHSDVCRDCIYEDGKECSECWRYPLLSDRFKAGRKDKKEDE